MDDIKPKKFLVVPRDALEMLTRRFANVDDATQAATDAVTEEGMTMYVLEMKLVAARETPPVKVRQL